MAASSSSSQAEGTNDGNIAFEFLLSIGKAFTGQLYSSSCQPPGCWRLNVRMLGCDLERGYICGTMEVLNLQIGRPNYGNFIKFAEFLKGSNIRVIPCDVSQIVTFWEGEIVDLKNYNFYTGKWHATPQDDANYWNAFPCTQPTMNALQSDGGNSLDLSNQHGHIYMRWKEQRYVSELTDSEFRSIAGFYYVCFCYNGTGTICAKYHKPEPGVTRDLQKFSLRRTAEGRAGMSFSSYQLQ